MANQMSALGWSDYIYNKWLNSSTDSFNALVAQKGYGYEPGAYPSGYVSLVDYNSYLASQRGFRYDIVQNFKVSLVWQDATGNSSLIVEMPDARWPFQKSRPLVQWGDLRGQVTEQQFIQFAQIQEPNIASMIAGLLTGDEYYEKKLLETGYTDELGRYHMPGTGDIFTGGTVGGFPSSGTIDNTAVKDTTAPEHDAGGIGAMPEPTVPIPVVDHPAPPDQIQDVPAALPTIDQGVGSGGVNPWDEQPDIPTIPAVVIGAQTQPFLDTTSSMKTDPAFLDWLHLQEPDAKDFNSVMGSSRELADYFSQWQKITTLSVPTIDRTAPNIFPPQPVETAPVFQLFGKTTDLLDLPVEFPEPPGGTPSVQKPATTLPAMVVIGNDFTSDLANQTAGVFYNQLSALYANTIQRIAQDPDARNQLNEIYVNITTGDAAVGDIESFLRNYSATVAQTKPVDTKVPDVKVPDVNVPPIDTGIGTGFLLAIAAVVVVAILFVTGAFGKAA
jgi:hypothetical protein